MSNTLIYECKDGKHLNKVGLYYIAARSALVANITLITANVD